MARRAQVQLALNASATDPNGFDWQGGQGMLLCDATFGGGSVALQILSPAAVWLPVNYSGGSTAISLTASGTANFAAPAGKLRVAITTATAVNAHVVGIPSNAGG